MEAGEHIAAANRAIAAANTNPKNGQPVPENKTIGNGGQEAMKSIKNQRDAYGHSTAPVIEGSQYSDAQNQQRLVNKAKEASKELSARIKTLETRLVEEKEPKKLTPAQREQVEIAVKELKAAQETLDPLAKNGPTKATELTDRDRARADEMDTLRRGNAHQSVAVSQLTPEQRRERGMSGMLLRIMTTQKNRISIHQQSPTKRPALLRWQVGQLP